MNNTPDHVVLGKFGRPQGLKGWIRLISYTHPEAAIQQYLPWCIQQQTQWLPLKIDDFQTQNQTILVKVAGYVDRESLAELTNCLIGVLPNQLPRLDPGDYYWHELMQMTVHNQDGQLLGKVVEILPTGAHDVLVISGEKRHLIPYVPKVHILSVDPIHRNIIVDWDEHF